MRRGDKAWFAGCVAGELLAYCGYVLAYRDVIRVDGGPRLPYRTVVRVVVASFGATVLGAAAGGLAVDYWALRRAKAGADEAVSRTLALHTLQWAVLALAAAAAAAAVVAGAAGGVSPALVLPWLVGVPVAFALALAVSSPRAAPRLTAAGRAERGALAAVRRAFADAVRALVLLRRLAARPLRYPGAVLGHPLYWAGDLVCLWCALQAFGVQASPAVLVLGYASGYVATALPLPAGGAGGIDASLTFALHLAGIPLAPALLAVFAYRAFSFWLELGIAVLLLPLLRRLRAELVESDREVAA